jgi:hypothetical protein
MGASTREKEFVLLLDRGAQWPSWLSALPAADALRVNVRGDQQSWDDFLRESLCKRGRRSRHDRSAIVFSVSSTDGARAALAALERCAAAVRYDDISLVAPEGSVTHEILAAVGRVLSAGARTLSVAIDSLRAHPVSMLDPYASSAGLVPARAGLPAHLGK